MSVATVQLRNGVVWNADDARAAEAEIARLRAEVERLRLELAELQALEMCHDGACVRLKAENERLRKLMGTVLVDADESIIVDGADAPTRLMRIRATARAALERKP